MSPNLRPNPLAVIGQGLHRSGQALITLAALPIDVLEKYASRKPLRRRPSRQQPEEKEKKEEKKD